MDYWHCFALVLLDAIELCCPFNMYHFVFGLFKTRGKPRISKGTWFWGLFPNSPEMTNYRSYRHSTRNFKSCLLLSVSFQWWSVLCYFASWSTGASYTDKWNSAAGIGIWNESFIWYLTPELSFSIKLEWLVLNLSCIYPHSAWALKHV